MEEQNDNKLQNTRQEAPKPQRKQTASSDEGRRSLLHLVCGGYLLYLAFKLLSGFAADFGKAGWTGSMIVSLIGGVVFAVVGVSLLVNLIKRFFVRYKEQEAGKKDENEDEK